jgi:microcystin-dependent protein
MSSPITAEDFNNQSPSQDLCDAFRNKLLNNDKLAQLLGYMFDADGRFSTGDESFGRDLVLYLMQSSSPIGSLMFAPSATPPNVLTSEWLPCDGGTYDKSDFPWGDSFVNFFGITEDVGAGTFTMPDYRRRYLRASGTGVATGSISEDEVASVVLTAAQVGAHTHVVQNADRVIGTDAWSHYQFGAGGGDTAITSVLVPDVVSGAAQTTLVAQAGSEANDPVDVIPAGFVATVFMRVGYRVAGAVVGPLPA